MLNRNFAAAGRRAVRATIEELEWRRLMAVFTVTTTADSGTGSLRDAITLANADQTLDQISFNIAGTGVQRIQPLTKLPKILGPVDLNGYTQPGASANTLAVGSDAKLLIELNGDLIADDGPALDFFGTAAGGPFRAASGSFLRGLIINGGFDKSLVHVDGTTFISDVTIAGNYIGTTAAGESFGAEVASRTLVAVEGYAAYRTLIGGPTPADRNVIGNAGDNGVSLYDRPKDNTLLNNYIGLNAAGSGSLGLEAGVYLSETDNTVIGGATPATRNVIHATESAIGLFKATNTRITGNYFNVNADGATTIALARGDEAISVTASSNTAIGGSPAESNLITNADTGVDVGGTTAVNNVIRFNSIFNTGTAIDIDADVNDFQDFDTGANNQQNFAAIVSAQTTADVTHVQTYFNSQPNSGYVVDFYSSPNNGIPQKGQLRTYLGTATVLTDGGGNALFTTDLPAVPVGSYLTNTATSLDTFPLGNTSQVGQAFEVTAAVVTPPPPPVLPTLSVNDVSTYEGNSGTRSLTFTVKLSAAAAGAVTVKYATQDGTAKTGDNDYVAKLCDLTFAPGETTKTVTVAVKGDTKSEIDETFKLLLSAATGATIADDTGVGTIRNDDTPPPPPAKPKLSVGGYTSTEGHNGTKAFTFKVTLDKSSASSITVKYATQDDSAKAGTDYNSLTGTLTFAAGETSKMITVYVKGDTTRESDEKFFLLLSNPTNATIAVGKGTGLIKNDD